MLRDYKTVSLQFKHADIGDLARLRRGVLDVVRAIYGQYAYEHIIKDVMGPKPDDFKRFEEGSGGRHSLEELFKTSIKDRRADVVVATKDTILEGGNFYILLSSYVSSGFDKATLQPPQSNSTCHLDSGDLGLLIVASQAMGTGKKVKVEELQTLLNKLRGHRDNPDVDATYSWALYSMRRLNSIRRLNSMRRLKHKGESP
ncbi:hypothetical protein HYU13_00665 [Candidatus Woesearchaeota archaeon]|nr:hypothetical protein [Candidatus Woesearchaeota archaeon]